MKSLIEMLYNLYINYMNKMEIGYGFDKEQWVEILQLYELIYFIQYCNPSLEEIALIADNYNLLEILYDYE
jgi:hypothetical protein